MALCNLPNFPEPHVDHLQNGGVLYAHPFCIPCFIFQAVCFEAETPGNNLNDHPQEKGKRNSDPTLLRGIMRQLQRIEQISTF